MAHKYMTGINGNALKANRPLTQGELMEVVPSIFSTEAHESRSERYAHISTAEVLEQLAGHGYSPFFAIQCNVRDEEKAGYTKHMLRLRKDNVIDTLGQTDEIILVNSSGVNNAAFTLLAGQFRFVCANGLAFGNTKSETKIRHSGKNIADDVIEGVYTVVNEFDEINRQQKEMSRIMLDDKRRQGLALQAYIIKEGMPEDMDFVKNVKYRPELLLKPHNPQDEWDNSLLSTFNVLQENLMKGGQVGFNANNRRGTARQITAIDKNLDVNTALWERAKLVLETA